jgi:hypothetical protein
MSDVCCRTATKASSKRRAWSSGCDGVVIVDGSQRGSSGSD